MPRAAKRKSIEKPLVRPSAPPSNPLLDLLAAISVVHPEDLPRFIECLQKQHAKLPPLAPKEVSVTGEPIKIALEPGYLDQLKKANRMRKEWQELQPK